jgi:hypothetical protein
MKRTTAVIAGLVAAVSATPLTAHAVTLWNTLIDPAATGQIGFLSQQNSQPETEAIDDFVINPAAFPSGFTVNRVRAQALLTDPNAQITNLTVELYRTFPVDSNTTRSPQFTRTNGPSDNGQDFADFASKEGKLSFTRSVQNPTFVLDRTIEPGADGKGVQVTDDTSGQLVLLDMSLGSGITLAPTNPFPSDNATHYWLELTAEVSSGEFYWVQGTFPRSVPGGAPAAGEDRQTWFTTELISPDFRRVSDIINQQDGTTAPVFNSSMEIIGRAGAVPEPSMLMLLASVGGLLVVATRRRRRVDQSPGSAQ